MPLPESPKFVAEGDTLTINGERWLVYIGRGHAPEHLCLYRSTDRLLLSGDQVLPTISSNLMVRPTEPDANPVTAFVDSLTVIRDALPEDTWCCPPTGCLFGACIRGLMRWWITMLSNWIRCRPPAVINRIVRMMCCR